MSTAKIGARAKNLSQVDDASRIAEGRLGSRNRTVYGQDVLLRSLAIARTSLGRGEVVDYSRLARVSRYPRKAFCICSRTVVKRFKSPPPTSAVVQPVKLISSSALRTSAHGRSSSGPVSSVQLFLARL